MVIAARGFLSFLILILLVEDTGYLQKEEGMIMNDKLQNFKLV